MRWTTRFAPFLLATLAGCAASQAEAEAHAQKIVDAVNDLAGTMSTIKDGASSQAAHAKIQEAVDRLKYLKDHDVKVTKTTEEAVLNNFRDKITTSFGKLGMELARIRSIPGTTAEVSLVESALQSLTT